MQNENKKIMGQTLQEKVSSFIPKEFIKDSGQQPSNLPPVRQREVPARNTGPLKSLRTFQGDMEETLSKSKGSIVSVVIDEQKRQEERPELKKMKEPEEISTVKNKFFIMLGGLLLILGIATVSAVYFIKSKNPEPEKTEKTIIGYYQEKNINIASTTRKNLLSQITKEKQNFKTPVNSVLYFNFIDSLGRKNDIKEVMNILAPQMPADLFRSLENKYMVGILSYDTNEPFIILTGSDYGVGYSAMLRWEKTIISDLGSIFSLEGNDAVELAFEDEAIKNKDLRIVKNKNRKTVLLYSFLDKNTILITANENIFNSILSKYNTSKMAR